MICVPQAPEPLVTNWLERHSGLLNFSLHILGIPPTFFGVLLIPVYLFALSFPIFLLALGLFVGGYTLQFLGHLLEGNEPGEMTALRNWGAGRQFSPIPTHQSSQNPV